jgi:hypothetical protein
MSQRRKLFRVQTAVAIGLAVSIAIAILVVSFRPERPLPKLAPTDAGVSDRHLLELDAIPLRAVDGLTGIAEERHPGPEARVLLLGRSVHACRFDHDFGAMMCREIEHATQYGPHGEPDVGFAESEPGAPDWVVVPARGEGAQQALPDLFFELQPHTRVLARTLWVKAFAGRDRALSVIQIYLEEDVLVHGRAGEAMRRVSLPAASGATQLVGDWLLWSGENDRVVIAHASSDGLTRPQTLPGKSSGAACHTQEGTRILGTRDHGPVLFVETQGSWSTLSDISLPFEPLPSTDRGRFEQDLTTLTCMNRLAVIIAQSARRLDPKPNAGIEDCSKPDACRFLLELGIARCDSRRCTSEPRRAIELGAGGFTGRPRVLPMADGLLVLWMTHAGTLRMKRIRGAGDGLARDIVHAPLTQLVSAWSNDSIATVLLTERGRGAQAIRLGSGDDDVNAVGQR